MTKIVIYLSTIDGFDQTRPFDDIYRAREFAVNYVGENPEICRGYAVAGDGVAKVRVQGCTLNELFAGEFEENKLDLPFAVMAMCVNEDAGTVSKYAFKSFATFDEAAAFMNSDEAVDAVELHDGSEIVGQTEESRAEIKARREAAWHKFLDDQGEREESSDGIPF